MLQIRRLLMLASWASILVAAVAVTDWVAMSRHDTHLPVGGRWFVVGRPDRWEFNADPGGWSLSGTPGGGGFIPDGLNATLTLERHYPLGTNYTPPWAERTVGSVRVRDILLASLACPTAWIGVVFWERRRRISRGFPIGP